MTRMHLLNLIKKTVTRSAVFKIHKRVFREDIQRALQLRFSTKQLKNSSDSVKLLSQAFKKINNKSTNLLMEQISFNDLEVNEFA